LHAARQLLAELTVSRKPIYNCACSDEHDGEHDSLSVNIFWPPTFDSPELRIAK
jgi:hypothetical protein